MTKGEGLSPAIHVVDKILKQLGPASPEVRDLQLRCPEEIGVLHVIINTSRLPRNEKFRIEAKEISRVDVRDAQTLVPQYDCASNLPDGASLDLRHTDGERLFLEIQFAIPDQTLMRRLVYREHDRDGKSSGENDVYWMSAQVRDANALESRYGRVDLRDFDFLVNVGIHQDVKSSVPRIFVRQMEVGVRLVNETDRNKKFALMQEQLRLQQAGLSKSADILTEIQDLFVPSRFSSFIDVTKQFRLSTVRRGTDIYDRAPFPTFPKSMSVVSRTDLSVSNPASNGELVYKRTDFRTRLGEFFPKSTAKLLEESNP
jgi:hypothetical protein